MRVNVNFNFYMITFIIAAVLVITWGTYHFYAMNQGSTALLFFIGSLTLFIIYGIRWFGPTPLFTPTSGPWPPVMNTCPDYLTYYQRTVGGVQKDTCIDLIGVSKDNSLLSTFPKTGSPPDSDSYYLDISGTSSDPNTKSTQLCNIAMNQKVTWEGMTNGESCIGPSGVPGSSGSGSGSGSGSSC